MPDGNYLRGELTSLDESNSTPCPRCGELLHLSEAICPACAVRAVNAAISRGDCITITEAELDGEVALRLGADGSVSVEEITDGSDA